MSLPLTSFASVIIGVSASVFLSNSFFSYHSFPYRLDFRTWPILLESMLAYLIGFVLILRIDKYLNRSSNYPYRMVERKEVSFVLATLVVILTMLMGVLGSSFKYVNILSYTIFVLALVYFILTSRKKTKYLLHILGVGGVFLVLVLPVMNSTTGSTHLQEVSILEAKERGDSLYLEMDIILLQENGDSMNICAEMIFLEGTAKENAECVKVVDFLGENSTSRLHWSVILHTLNEECMAYLFIWSSLGENEYLRIEIKKVDQVWKPFKRELGFLEYLKVYYYSRLKKIYQSLEILFTEDG
jgi:hypothetical protein